MIFTYDTYGRWPDMQGIVRLDVCTRFEDAERQRDHYKKRGTYCFTLVWKDRSESIYEILDSEDSWEAFRTSAERVTSWTPTGVASAPTLAQEDHSDPLPGKGPQFVDDDGFHSASFGVLGKPPPEIAKVAGPKASSKINPDHYRHFMGSFQWIETICRLERFKGMRHPMMAALEFTVRGYLDRAGRKGTETEVEDLSKALWYLKFMVAFAKSNYEPILVSQVENILAEDAPK